MKLLQAGMAKSGNLWLYKILQSVYICGDLPQSSFIRNQPIHELAKTWELSFAAQADADVMAIEPNTCSYRISSIFRMPIVDIDDYVNRCSHVWTHSAYCERTPDIFSKFDKIVYIIRDPRSVAVSKSRFVFTPYMQKYYPSGHTDPAEFLDERFVTIMRNWTNHVGAYIAHKDNLNFHVVFYERLLRSFDREFQGLLDYLGIQFDRETIEKIKQDVDFRTMQQNDPNHVRKGSASEWRQVLTEQQKRRAVTVTGPMLRLLNYPLSDDDDSLPELPEQLDRIKLDRAMAEARRDSLLRRAVRKGRWVSRQAAQSLRVQGPGQDRRATMSKPR